MPKIYIGDGIYADSEAYILTLTTENGVETSNAIYMGRDELIALFRFAIKEGYIETKDI